MLLTACGWIERMTLRPVRFVAVSVLTCTFVLTGCTPGSAPVASGTSGGVTSGGSTSTAATGSGTSSEAPGDEVTGRSGSFTVVPPEGWAEATDRAKDVANIDLVLLSSRKVDGFANNLVVITIGGDESALEQELAKGREQMAALGRTVTDAPDRTVAGTAARGFTTTFKQQGIDVVARSYALQRNGKIYLLTLSASHDDADHALAELDDLASTWVWK